MVQIKIIIKFVVDYLDMPRVKLFDEKEALLKATDLFWEKGYANTSLSDLIKTLGISKGSFYDTFNSKREIFDRSMKHYQQLNIGYLQQLLESEPNVQQGIRTLFLRLINVAFDDSLKRGCLMANTCSELAGSDDAIRTFLQGHNAIMFDLIKNYLKGGGLKYTTDINALSNLILTQLTGMNVELKFRATKEEVMNASELIVGLIQ